MQRIETAVDGAVLRVDHQRDVDAEAVAQVDETRHQSGQEDAGGALLLGVGCSETVFLFCFFLGEHHTPFLLSVRTVSSGRLAIPQSRIGVEQRLQDHHGHGEDAVDDAALHDAVAVRSHGVLDDERRGHDQLHGQKVAAAHVVGVPVDIKGHERWFPNYG